MSEKRNRVITGGICSYSLSIFFYYTMQIFFYGKVENISTMAWTGMMLSIILFSVGIVGFGWKSLERASIITRFELTVLFLIFIMIALELKQITDVSLIPGIIAVAGSLTDITRTVKFQRVITGLIGGLCFVLAIVLVKEKTIFSIFINAFITMGRKIIGMIYEAVTSFFEFILFYFSGGDKYTAKEYGAESPDVSGSGGFIAIIILLSFVLLLVGVLSLCAVKALRKRRKSKQRKGKPVSKQNWISTPSVTEDERNGSYLKGISQWRFFFMPASTPEIFLFKASRICRKSEYRLKKTESPRQFINRLVKADFLNPAIKESLEVIGVQVDQFYYAASFPEGVYRRKQGEDVLKELKACLKRNRKRKIRNY